MKPRSSDLNRWNWKRIALLRMNSLLLLLVTLAAIAGSAPLTAAEPEQETIGLKLSTSFVSIEAGDSYTIGIEVGIQNANDTILLTYSNATESGGVALHVIPNNVALSTNQSANCIVQIVSSIEAKEGNYSFMISAVGKITQITDSTDLIVMITTSTDLVASRLWVYPTSPQEGGRANFFASVINAGPKPVEDVQTAFLLDGSNFKNVTIHSIGENQNITVSVQWDQVVMGNHSLEFVVDPNALIPERSRANNILQLELMVQASYFSITVIITGLDQGTTSVYVNGTLQSTTASTWCGTFEIGHEARITLEPNVITSPGVMYTTDEYSWPGIGSSTTISVHYYPSCYLSVNSSPDNLVPVMGTGWYRKGTQIPLTAPSEQGLNPEVELRFWQWSVGSQELSTQDSIPFTVNEPVNLTANYVYFYRVSIVQTSYLGELVPLEVLSGECDGSWCKAGTQLTWRLAQDMGQAIGPLGLQLFLKPNCTTGRITVTGPVRIQLDWAVDYPTTVFQFFATTLAIPALVVTAVLTYLFNHWWGKRHSKSLANWKSNMASRDSADSRPL